MANVKFLLLLILGIFVHELGHYLMARFLKIRADIFCLGNGPEVFSFNKFGTKFMLKAFPLGGHIHLDIDIPNLSKEEKFKIAAISLAGPFFALFTGLLVIKILPLYTLITILDFVGNLLPIPGFDGGQFITCILSGINHEDKK